MNNTFLKWVAFIKEINSYKYYILNRTLFSLLSRNHMLSRPLPWTERHLMSGCLVNMLEVNECEYETGRYIVGGGI